jgi:thiamine transport system substrate-binding protein
MPAEGAMRHRVIHFYIPLLAIILIFSSCLKKQREDSPGPLVAYVYDSFASEWGPGPEIIRRFKADSGIEIQFVSLGDAGQVLARAVAEKEAPKADIIIGVDGNLLPRALKEKILLPYKPKRAETLPVDLVLDPQWHVSPYDWGAFAIIWDSEKLSGPPESLEELTDPRFAKKLVIMDPRSSSPGLGFLAWTVAVYGDKASDYWKRLRPSVLTMSPSWDSGYGLFVEGEVPLVLSYTTSPAYHLENEKSSRYKALIFGEGHPVQIEGAGILSGTTRLVAAQAFIDFLLSEEVQALLPATQWMYPIDPSIRLPESFSAARKPAKLLHVDPNSVNQAIDAAIQAIGNP